MTGDTTKTNGSIQNGKASDVTLVEPGIDTSVIDEVKANTHASTKNEKEAKENVNTMLESLRKAQQKWMTGSLMSNKKANRDNVTKFKKETKEHLNFRINDLVKEIRDLQEELVVAGGRSGRVLPLCVIDADGHTIETDELKASRVETGPTPSHRPGRGSRSRSQ